MCLTQQHFDEVTLELLTSGKVKVMMFLLMPSGNLTRYYRRFRVIVGNKQSQNTVNLTLYIFSVTVSVVMWGELT